MQLASPKRAARRIKRTIVMKIEKDDRRGSDNSTGTHRVHCKELQVDSKDHLVSYIRENTGALNHKHCSCTTSASG